MSNLRPVARAAITSLGVSPGQSYAVNRATLYTCQIVATNNAQVISEFDWLLDVTPTPAE